MREIKLGRGEMIVKVEEAGERGVGKEDGKEGGERREEEEKEGNKKERELLIMWMECIAVEFGAAVEESCCLDTVVCNLLQYADQILSPTAIIMLTHTQTAI